MEKNKDLRGRDILRSLRRRTGIKGNVIAKERRGLIPYMPRTEAATIIRKINIIITIIIIIIKNSQGDIVHELLRCTKNPFIGAWTCVRGSIMKGRNTTQAEGRDIINQACLTTCRSHII
jgi:hypothetical protein